MSGHLRLLTHQSCKTNFIIRNPKWTWRKNGEVERKEEARRGEKRGGEWSRAERSGGEKRVVEGSREG